MPVSVACIGMGTFGLVALKNMLEEGMEATGFELSGSVGGLWNVSEDESVTSALPETRCNWSKHRMATADFPHLESTSIHPTQAEMASWHHRYAQHFGLSRRIKLNSRVESVSLLPSGQFEVIFVENSGSAQKMLFDKVYLAIGLQSKPFTPDLPGLSEFRGVVKHSKAFKTGAPFKGKRCIVVGSRSSASDICEVLTKNGASQVYLSHRGGVIVLPRFWLGSSIDFFFNRRGQNILNFLDSIYPYTTGWAQNKILQLMSSTTFRLRPKWNFKPYPNLISSIPTISDTLIPQLESGQIISVPLIASVSPESVTLTDGSTLEDIDAIIFATGFDGTSPTILSPSTLAAMASPPFVDAPSDDLSPAPGRFQMIYKACFSPSLPSIAMTIQGLGLEGVPCIADVKTMWISSVWSGRVKLPSEEEMWKSTVRDKRWWNGLHDRVPKPNPGHVPFGTTMAHYASEAGCEIDEHLSWTSWSAWKFWLAGGENRRLTRLLLDGMASPGVYRLWGRRRWEGAREMIERANKKEAYAKPSGKT